MMLNSRDVTEKRRSESILVIYTCPFRLIEGIDLSFDK